MKQPCDGATDDWLCPGWEKCASSRQECSRSRCCVDDSNGCFLNQTLWDNHQKWQAFCEPPTTGTARTSPDRVQLHPVGEGEGLFGADPATRWNDTSLPNLTSRMYFYTEVSVKHAFCEGTSEWLCWTAWEEQATEYMAAMNAGAEGVIKASGLGPAVILGLVVLSVLIAAGAIFRDIVYRRRLQQQLTQLKGRLESMREAQIEAKEKANGGESVIGLVAK